LPIFLEINMEEARNQKENEKLFILAGKSKNIIEDSKKELSYINKNCNGIDKIYKRV